MELNQIRYAYYVAKYRSFSKAADHLFVTQPTLSQQIHKLEDELTFPLFIRSTRAVLLTHEGELFFEKSKQLLDVYDRFTNEMAALRGMQGHALSVGLLPTFLDFKMSDVFQRFQAQNTDISISFEVLPSDKLIKKLQARKHDVIIAYITPSLQETLDKKIEMKIIDSHLVNVALHENNPLSKKEMVSVEDLANQTLLMLEKESAVEQEVQNTIQQYDIVPKRIKRYPAFRSMLGSVAMNQGLCFHSAGVGSEFINYPLVSIPFAPNITMLTAIMYLKERSGDEAVQRLCKYLNDNM